MKSKMLCNVVKIVQQKRSLGPWETVADYQPSAGLGYNGADRPPHPIYVYPGYSVQRARFIDQASK